MTKILVLGRDYLSIKSKLKEAEKIEFSDFATLGVQKEDFDEAEIVIFYCSLLHRAKILKNRTNAQGDMFYATEGMKNLALFMMDEGKAT